MGDTRPFAWIFGSWVYDENGKSADDSRRLKTTVAAELGRLIDRYSDGMECAVKLAQEICEWQMKAKEAVRMVREFRRAVKPDAPDPKDRTNGLWDHLSKAIQDYRIQHPRLKTREVEEVLSSLWSWYGDEAEDEEKEGDEPAA